MQVPSCELSSSQLSLQCSRGSGWSRAFIYLSLPSRDYRQTPNLRDR